MNFNLTRRDLLLAASGSAAGLVLSPVPWKLLGDSAIWTQRSRFAPETLRGDMTTRFSACTLCPAGCALRARCFGPLAVPVSLTGVPGHPVSHGALCPTGLTAHHLPRHPLRLTGPARITRKGRGFEAVPVKREAVVAAVADAVQKARASGAAVPLALLDLRPGRAASALHRRLLSGVPGALQVNAPSRAGATLDAMSARVAPPTGPLGVDFEKPRTIVSFGAPLLEGWGTPGTVASIVARRNAASNRLRVVQVEPHRSPTAEGADLWLPIVPGTEAAVALGLAHVLMTEGLVSAEAAKRAVDLEGPASFRSFVLPFDPASVERTSGIPAASLRDLARDLARGPALVLGAGAPGSEPLGREEESAIAALNLLLGSMAPGGSVVARRELPSAKEDGSMAPMTSLDQVSGGSVGVLVIEGSGEPLPWESIAAKLAPGATVVSLSPWLSGPALQAAWAVPSPAPLECLDEALTPAGAGRASWALAPALLAAPPKATPPAVFLAELATALGSKVETETAETFLKGRASAIMATGRGTVFVPGTATPSPLAGIGGANGLFEKLLAGGAWVDDPLPAPKDLPRFNLLPSQAETAKLAAVATKGRTTETGGTKPRSFEPEGYVGATGAVPEPALLGKLGRESLLRARSAGAARRATPVTIWEA